jgi:hypothetical protein
VDLLRGGLVVFDGEYYYMLALLTEHDASDRCPVRISENSGNAKFAERGVGEVRRINLAHARMNKG